MHIGRGRRDGGGATIAATAAALSLAAILCLFPTLPPAAAAQDNAPPPPPQREAVPRAERILDSVVRLRAQIPAEARTASYLGTEREGSGVVIDDDGLVVTIGYLITEAMGVEIVPNRGKPVRGAVVGFDNESGLGVVRALEPLDVKPLPLGHAAALRERQPVLVASFGGPDAAQPAVVVGRHEFAGYWEYLLDDAIFTVPAHPNWGGAALIGGDGKLLGIGSLTVRASAAGEDSDPGNGAAPGNMFVPIDRLQPILGDLLALGRPGTPQHPWLGVNCQELFGHVVVVRVSPDGPAEQAGLSRGDTIQAVAGTPVRTLPEFYRTLWRRGDAGVEVPLTVGRGHGGDTREVTVKSIDRYKYLKLGTTY